VGTDKRARQKANRDRARKERIRKQQFTKVRNRGLLFGLGIPAIILALFLISNYVMKDSTPEVIVTDSTVAETVATIPGKQITGKTPCPKTDGTEDRATKFQQAPTMCIDPAKSYTAIFDTNQGTIEVALDTKKTPNTVNNFVTLSRYKYYDTSFIFRTDVNLDIIQGGGATNTDVPGYTIKDEGAGFAYKTGDLVMARSSGNDSGGGQFFFVTGPKASVLDSQGTYVTFGSVTKGLDITQKILGMSAGEGALGGAPKTPVKINSVTITEK
jgi:cyclophilin family peptidyl-prolyl cis-trans isomerase